MPSARSALPITVVIPAYNAAPWIAATLDSLLGQVRPPAETIVVDDGSSDATGALAHRDGVRVIRQVRAGIAGARNAGIAAARESWIALLDADDVWDSEKLAAQWDAIDTTDAAWCFTDYFEFGEDGVTCRSVLHDIHGHSQKAERRAFDNHVYLYDRVSLACAQTFDPFILPSSCLVHRDLLAETGGFRNVVLSEDVDWFLRALARAAPAYVDRTLVGYRRHHDATTFTGNPRLLEHYYNHLDLLLDRPHEYVPEAVEVARRSFPVRMRTQATLYLRQADPASASRALLRLNARRPALATRLCAAALRVLALPPLRGALGLLRAAALAARSVVRRRAGTAVR